MVEIQEILSGFVSATLVVVPIGLSQIRERLAGVIVTIGIHIVERFLADRRSENDHTTRPLGRRGRCRGRPRIRAGPSNRTRAVAWGSGSRRRGAIANYVAARSRERNRRAIQRGIAVSISKSDRHRYRDAVVVQLFNVLAAYRH